MSSSMQGRAASIQTTEAFGSRVAGDDVIRCARCFTAAESRSCNDCIRARAAHVLRSTVFPIAPRPQLHTPPPLPPARVPAPPAPPIDGRTLLSSLLADVGSVTRAAALTATPRAADTARRVPTADSTSAAPEHVPRTDRKLLARLRPLLDPHYHRGVCVECVHAVLTCAAAHARRVQGGAAERRGGVYARHGRP